MQQKTGYNMPKELNPRELKGFMVYLTIGILSLLGYIWNGHTTWLQESMAKQEAIMEKMSGTIQKHETRISVLEVKTR